MSDKHSNEIDATTGEAPSEVTARAPQDRVFSFKVAGDPPQFTYDPVDAWIYLGEDTLFFETEAGPFTLGLIRTDAVEEPGAVQPFAPLTSEPKGDKHVAETTITDGRSREQRDSLWQENRTAANPEGFVGRYRYKLEVKLPDGCIASDDQKNGEYRC